MQSNDPSFPQTEFIQKMVILLLVKVIFSDALFNGQKNYICGC